MMGFRQFIADQALKLAYGSSYVQSPQYKIGIIAAKEVTAINQLFAQLGVRAEIDARNVVASDTGDFIRYKVVANGRIREINSVEKDLSVLMTALRGYDVNVNIREPSLIMELPYPLETKTLEWADANLSALRPFQCLLGMDYTKRKPAPATIDFSRKTVAHTLIAGATGSGKSVLVVGLITSLAHSTRPDQLAVVFLDPKFDADWKPLDDLPHVTMRSEPVDCVAAIASVKAELERRKRDHDDRKLVLVIDEYADFLGDLDKETRAVVEGNIRSITSVGRSLNIHVVLITQKPTVETVDTVAKGNLTTRIGGMVMTAEESKVAMGRSDLGCENLPGKGSFYVSVGGATVARIQSYLIDGDALLEAIDTIAQRWAGTEAFQIEMEAQTSSDSAYMPKLSEDELNAERILEHYGYGELFDDAGKVRRGMQAKAIKALFGEDAPDNGNPRRKTVAAINFIKREYASTDLPPSQ